MAETAKLANDDEAVEIDMDRVVADPDYRRLVITRLRRVRLMTQAHSGGDDASDSAVGDED